jgi:hypothetical protein
MYACICICSQTHTRTHTHTHAQNLKKACSSIEDIRGVCLEMLSKISAACLNTGVRRTLTYAPYADVC